VDKKSYRQDIRIVLASDPTLEHCVARMTDFFGSDTPWQRRLWGVGSSLVLQEVLEAAEFRHRGHFSELTLQDLCRTATKQIGPDPGIGAGELRGEICRCLAGNSLSGPHIQRQLAHLTQRAVRGYLSRLADQLDQGTMLEPEWLARSIASHLLDLGFSSEHLHRWLTKLAKGPVTVTMADLFSEAGSLEAAITRNYVVIVPMTRLPRRGVTMPENWMNATEVSQWLQTRAKPHKPIRQVGAFRFSITARDPWQAVDQVVELLERLSARVCVGIPIAAPFDHAGIAWVVGHRNSYRLRPIRRQVEIHTLHRQSLVYRTQDDFGFAIDAALQLLSSLDTGLSGSAIAGGWAAVESLLSGSDKGHLAAERLAKIVACSYPRAELTTLAYVHALESDDALATQLEGSSENRDRASLVADAILRGHALGSRGPSDDAALQRMRILLTSPDQVLKRVATYIEETLRRLYRQRNLVMHAGTTDSVVIGATLRTAPSLVGAGVDRIVHALSTEKLSPLGLAARAESELTLVGSSGGRDVVDLLE
jgi:hypothetical protein